ncbi:M56 family metallopeptidase [Aeoliella sp.]|uniref:M56 family metallopeptidase n=1 Tax=Aeoliella sp. TaxID=2795800 RepID=UPI003CCC0C45
MPRLAELLNLVENAFPFDVLDVTVKATVVLLLAALAVRLLRRSSAAVRHAVLASALLSTMALPWLSQSLPRWEVPLLAGLLKTETPTAHQPAAPAPPTATAVDAPNTTQTTAGKSAVVASAVTNAATERVIEPAPAASPVRWTAVALAVWLLGALALTSAIVVSEFRVRRLRRACRELLDTEWNRSLNEVTALHPLMRRIAMLESSAVTVPMTCGTIRPAIVIPPGFTATSPERRRILLHELAHVARFDVVLQALGRLACALFWFHPLAWWCLRHMQREREQACDDWVVRSGERATEYADQLVSLAERNLAQRTLPAAVGIVRGGNLEKRVRAMLSSDCSHAGVGRVRGMLLVAMCLCLCAVVAVVHPQPLSAADPAPPTPDSKEESPEPFEETKNDPTKSNSYTVPINVSGMAFDQQGSPISGATIYISSQRVLWDSKRLAETRTDENGRYQFEDVELPVERADTNTGRDHGGFILFGTADGYGFSWRPLKWYYPDSNPNTYMGRDRDRPRHFDGDDKIELDLAFRTSATIRGTIVDEAGKPVPKTKLAIWNAEQIPTNGYGPRVAGLDQRPFNEMDNDGFELLNADVPPEMWITHTDDEGRFEFTGVPSGCRFRVTVNPPSGFSGGGGWFATQPGMPKYYGKSRLYDATKDVQLTFRKTLDVPIQVIYADTGEPAPKVFVSGAGTFATTDPQGRVNLGMSPGEYKLHVLREYGTPYLETEVDLVVGDQAPSEPFVAELPAAAQVEVQVIDKETGDGLENVDFWSGESLQRRDLHYTTGWEVATRIVHRDRVRTDENGTIQALFEPGRHLIGVAWQAYPKGYRPVDPNGKEIECQAGEKLKVVFELERVSDD